MRRLILSIIALAIAADISRAQKPDPVANQPVEITSSGGTQYHDNIATAQENVAIHVGDTDIYADSAEYDPKARLIHVVGHVRIYRDISLYTGEEATYNVDTKAIHAGAMRSERSPYFIYGTNVTTISDDAFRVTNGILTTHDSSNPDFQLKAKTVRIYEKDRVIFQNVTMYVGKVPVFWWPYLYQSLDDSFGFMVTPAFLSSWGPSLLGQVAFPITDKIKGRLRLDYRARRGEAIGFESDIHYGKNDKNFAQIRTYFLQDQNPDIDRTSIPRGDLPESRYRLTLQDRTFFRDDLYATVNITKLSDAYVLEDFYQGEFRVNPQPDNVVALTKTDPFYSLNAVVRFQANEFFDTTERLPEITLDIKRHALFGGPIFYEGETGFAQLQRSFPDGSPYEDYSTFRLDTFHQFLYPHTYFGWFSFVPRVGFRGTYYEATRDLSNTLVAPNPNPLVPNFLIPDPSLDPNYGSPLKYGEGAFRTVFNAGAEASFKISRTWEQVQNSAIGLDGLRHIIQPFTDFSYVSNPNTNPAEILQFDRYEPSTQLRPIDFPQFTPIDSIDQWTIWRVGVRNRLQTRRDDLTISWLELETYVDVNFVNPFDKTPYSNLFNNLSFSPLPWLSLGVSSQVPAFDKGFTEIDTSINVQPVSSVQITLAHRYLNSNPFFPNSSLYVFGGYYRINDNWGIGVQEQYEATTGILEEQRYSVYRDLTSWVTSFGAVIRDNGGVKEYGILLTFTLKAIPKLGFDFNFDPGGAGEQ